jgi:hypothetical protein
MHKSFDRVVFRRRNRDTDTGTDDGIEDIEFIGSANGFDESRRQRGSRLGQI